MLDFAFARRMKFSESSTLLKKNNFLVASRNMNFPRLKEKQICHSLMNGLSTTRQTS